MKKDLSIILDINTPEIERFKKNIKIVYEEERYKNQEASLSGLSETYRLLDVGYRGDLYDLKENIDRIIEKKFKELKSYYNICLENANLYRIDYIYWQKKAFLIKKLMNKIKIDMGHSDNIHLVDTDSIRTITIINIPYVFDTEIICNCVFCGKQIDYENSKDIWIHGVFGSISSPSFERDIPEFIRKWGLSDENIPLRINTKPLIVDLEELKLEQSKSIQSKDNQVVMKLKKNKSN